MGWKIIFIIACLILLTACAAPGARRERAKPSPTPVPAGVTPAPGTPAPTPVTRPKGAVLPGTFVRLFDDPPTLDPHLTTDAVSATIIIEVFGGLVTISPDLRIVPDLAESWDVSPDGRTYTFHLRSNAKFHSGKPVTAHDFKWSLERAASPRTQSPVADTYLSDILGAKEKLKGQAAEIKGVRVIDDYTLEIAIDAPKAYFLAKLTYPTAFVVDRDNVEKDRRWFRNPNGTGPFRLAEYVPGERLILKPFKEYHLGAPKLEEVRFILSGGTSMLMYENDEIQIAPVGLADIDRVLDPRNPLSKELQKAQPTFSVDYIGMNVKEPPFDDPKVRLALNYAIDREEIARSVLADLVVPAKGILPPGFPAFNPNLKGYDYNPEKARQLLKESKYGADMSKFPRIILTVSGGFGASVGLDLEVILEMWRKNLGIQVEIQQTEFATYLQDLNKRRFQMFEIGWIADYPDPENFLDLLFHSEHTTNHSAYSNPQLDRLLEQARVERDESKRFELYQRAEEIILQDPPWIPLWHSGERYVLIKPYVKDYYLTQLIVPKLRFVSTEGR